MSRSKLWEVWKKFHLLMEDQVDAVPTLVQNVGTVAGFTEPVVILELKRLPKQHGWQL